MKTTSLILLACVVYPVAVAQPTYSTVDSSKNEQQKRLTIGGYVDAYYAYNFNDPESGDQPYLVSMSRHNEININVAFIDVKYSARRLRARLVPGFGTYMNANYSQESGTLKNLIEANAGVKFFNKKEIWLDVGILSSPYTNESPISKDHLAYTRSLAAENVPYYLSGAKLTLPVSKKINAYLYIMNGWQQITDKNKSKSFGSQIEFRPTNSILLNWNTYIGKETTAKDSVAGTRYFSDFYIIYSKDRLSLTSCIYYGLQQNHQKYLPWWQVNVITRYAFNSTVSGSLRLEYFDDQNGVLIVPITSIGTYETFGISAGINVQIENHILFRTEARQFLSSDQIFQNGNEPASSSLTLTASLCAWF